MGVSEKTSGDTELSKENNSENSGIEKTANSEAKFTNETEYSPENSELNSFLDDATQTVEEKADEEKAQIKAAKKKMTPKRAHAIAVGAISSLTEKISESVGFDVSMGDDVLNVFGLVFTPIILKYEDKINFDPDGVDLDSRTPEYLAIGGTLGLVGMVGYPIKKRANEVVVKNQSADRTESEAVTNGNKS